MAASRIEVVRKVVAALDHYTEDPAEEIQKLGNALVAIGKALKGLSIADARNVMRAVSTLNGGEALEDLTPGG